jgi:hypothetical protein
MLLNTDGFISSSDTFPLQQKEHATDPALSQTIIQDD